MHAVTVEGSLVSVKMRIFRKELNLTAWKGEHCFKKWVQGQTLLGVEMYWL